MVAFFSGMDILDPPVSDKGELDDGVGEGGRRHSQKWRTVWTRAADGTAAAGSGDGDGDGGRTRGRGRRKGGAAGREAGGGRAISRSKQGHGLGRRGQRSQTSPDSEQMTLVLPPYLQIWRGTHDSCAAESSVTSVRLIPLRFCFPTNFLHILLLLYVLARDL
ncbi:hypothetical protein BS78_09G052800 [Paspalum vaginatum]|nr:hypothetical protein BS78_09G052800 [Paspalum vaginatum]